MSEPGDRPVLFLDFDGVLNLGPGWRVTRPTFAPGPMVQLDRVVRETDCAIVVSSAWRVEFSPRALGRLLHKAGLSRPECVIGKTPDLSQSGANRGHEIWAWLENAKHKGAYAIADDTDDMIPSLEAHFVHVSSFTGLIEEDGDALIALLRPGVSR